MKIKFGPSGIGPVKEAIYNLEKYHQLGLHACEIAFTYGAYIKNKEDGFKIRKAAEKLKIQLSIHAPYWINLNSIEKEKVEASKKRILKSCEVGTWLGATRIVFHPGYYGKKGKGETYNNIRNEITKIHKEVSKKGYTPKLAPETTGKINVFGSIDEVHQLVEDTKCSFCIDFAHILAREKDYMFEEVFKKFKKHKDLHIHFTGIVHGEKGEKHHKKTSKEELKKLLNKLPNNKNITIINESPFPVQDSVLGLKIFKNLSKLN